MLQEVPPQAITCLKAPVQRTSPTELEDIGKMEKYRLVQEHKGDGDDFLEPSATCEVRITQQGKPRNYISYAMSLFVRTTNEVFLLDVRRDLVCSRVAILASCCD